MRESSTLHGRVKNGVIVPDDGIRLPEGAAVKFVVRTMDFTPEEKAEFDAWERLSDEAWEQIDWGDEEGNDAAR